jgi:predicted O-methyltransferase YrrM
MNINNQPQEMSPYFNANWYYSFPNKVGAMCVDQNHLNWFIEQLKNYNSYLEIGTFDGIALSVYAETYPDKKFTAIDAFEIAYGTGNGHLEYVCMNCKHMNNINLHIGRSINVLPTITDNFDMIFIDGAHDYNSIKNDYEMCWRLLNQGGMLIFHDIHLESTLAVIKQVEEEQGLIRQETNVGVVYFIKEN